MITQNTNNRLSPSILNADQDIFQGLQTLTDYRPQRQEASISQISTISKFWQFSPHSM